MLASFWGYCCDEAMDKKNGKSLAINTVSTMESLVSHFFNHDTSIYQQELNREGVMYYVHRWSSVHHEAGLDGNKSLAMSLIDLNEFYQQEYQKGTHTQ